MATLPRVLAALLLALALVGCVSGVDDAPRAGSGSTVQGEAARVVRVVDGDTIIIDRGDGDERLRYIGIDTPETVKPDSPVEPFGREASDANQRLVGGRDVILERDISDRDQFDRLLRYVWIETPEGLVLVNEELVALGLAAVRAYEPDTKYHDRFLRAESRARDAGLGVHAS
jgi:micrococcal nuclease